MEIRLFRTESFRLAALFAALLMGAMLLLSGVLYLIVDNAFRNEIIANARDDLAAIRRGYNTEGLSEAVEVVNQRMTRPAGSDFLLLENTTERKYAGNLRPRAPIAGVLRISVSSYDAGLRGESRHRSVLGVGEYVAPGVYAFAGQDLAVIDGTKEKVLQATGWILAVTLLLSVGGGVLFSRSFLRRADAITRTCQSIMAGRLSDRIPDAGTNDELGRLAAVINAMLDRIGALMDNVRQISSDIAHDLRTPLTRLHNRLEISRNEATTVSEYRSVVDSAMDDVESILSTFSALLRIGQIEASAIDSRFRPVDLEKLVNELVDIYGPAAEDRSHVLRISATERAHVLGDRELLCQLIVNLIENALSHTPDGTTVSIALERRNGAVWLSVRDNGPGIPPEEHDRVFRRFYRLEKSRSTPGSGLGLSLVAAIAHLHHATIALSDADPGLCATVKFREAVV